MKNANVNGMRELTMSEINFVSGVQSSGVACVSGGSWWTRIRDWAVGKIKGAVSSWIGKKVVTWLWSFF